MTRTQALWLLAAVLPTISGLACARLKPAPMSSPTIEPRRLVDLTYDFGPETIYWPTGESFHLERTAYGRTPEGYWYAAHNLCMAEHGGTHMDAPLHFAEHGWSTEQVPLASLVGPAAVIDIRSKAERNPDYELTVADILDWERQWGRLPKGAIVVLYSGWGRYWGDKKAYLGSDRPRDVLNLHFPGFSVEAAEFLVRQRDIAAVAVDTASIDHGPSRDFPVHRIVNGANKPAFENVANVHLLPPSGATMIALPMKIKGGSGGPTRIIALLPAP